MAKTACSMGLFFLVATACITMSARLSAGQAAPAPGPDCNSILVELFPCLDFLTNSSVNIVPSACCLALTNVSLSSPYCLCEVISPAFANQSAQLGINDTRALQLPGLCRLSLSPSNCAALLGPSAAAAPLAFVPASAPAPISRLPVPAISPSFGLTPVPAPVAGSPVSSPESSASPGPSVDCNPELTSLQSCLSFVTGTAKAPSSSCCTNLGSVVSTAPRCLCSLADSTAISSVNATLVQELPQLCSVPVSLSECSSVGAPSIPTGSEGPGGSPGNYGEKSAASSSFYTLIAIGVVALSHALFQ